MIAACNEQTYRDDFDGARMSVKRRADLEKRIRDNRRKIEEMRVFEDDPKFAKIIRAFRQQIAQDSYELSLMEPNKGQD